MKDPESMLKLADRLGFCTASVYVRLYELYRSQRKRQRHFHAGRYWVRMPYEDFPRMFPELSEPLISEALRRLEDKGLLMMVHYGSLGWDAINRISRRVV